MCQTFLFYLNQKVSAIFILFDSMIPSVLILYYKYYRHTDRQTTQLLEVLLDLKIIKSLLIELIIKF